MVQKLKEKLITRVKIIQKIYGSLMNPDAEIVYPKKVNIKNILKMLFQVQLKD